MFPFFRTSSIFRSRWLALLWAAGICWTAVQFAGSGDVDSNGAITDVSGAQVSAQEMRDTEALLKKLGS